MQLVKKEIKEEYEIKKKESIDENDKLVDSIFNKYEKDIKQEGTESFSVLYQKLKDKIKEIINDNAH